jgi:hypothetical protein
MNLTNWYHGGYRDWLRHQFQTAGDSLLGGTCNHPQLTATNRNY